MNAASFTLGFLGSFGFNAQLAGVGLYSHVINLSEHLTEDCNHATVTACPEQLTSRCRSETNFNEERIPASLSQINKLSRFCHI